MTQMGSRDGSMGRCGSRISPQLGCLPDAGGGPRCPRRQEEPPSDWVGCGGTEWGGEVEAWQDQCHWGVGLGWGRGSHAWRDPQGLRSGGACLAFPLPNQPGKPSWLSGQVLCTQRPTPGHTGPGGIGRRPGENRRGRWEGPSRTRGAGEERRAFAPPTRAGEACWAPRPGPLPSETRGSLGPFCWVEPKPSPQPPTRAFSSSVDNKHRPRPLPKPGPCLRPTSHSQGLFCPFFFFPPHFYYCDSVLPSGCCFIYIFIFIFFLTYINFLV